MGDTTADAQVRKCPGCEEIFDDKDHKVRRLVCGHEICVHCVSLQTEERKYVICAVCNKKHSITEEFGNEAKATNGQKPHELCAAHNRESALYCKSCDECICLQCLIRVHNGHELIDLVEQDRVKLKDRVEGQNSELDQWLNIFLKARADLIAKTKLSIDGLVSKRIELVSMVAKIDEFRQQAKKRCDSELVEINKKFMFIAAQKIKAETLAEMIEKETERSRINALTNIIQQLEQDIESKLNETARYKYYEYRYSEASEEETEKLCGKILDWTQILSIEPNGKAFTLIIGESRLSVSLRPSCVADGTINTIAFPREDGKLFKYSTNEVKC